MISKELLSKVLGFECSSYKELGGDDNIIYPLVHYGWVKGIEQISNAKQYPKGINIYELAHKCKEWALGKDFVLYSGSTHRTKKYRCDIYTKDGDVDEDFVSDTEPKAIFKACEWIRTQIAS